MAAKTAAPTTFDVPMSLAKETKGTFVFHADDESAPVTQVYVRKEGFPNGAPATIVLTVTE